MKPTEFKLNDFLFILALGLFFGGCTLMGKNAAPPTKFEQSMFNVSNTIVPRVITVTNVVSQTNVVVTPIFVTNTDNTFIQVPVYTTNVSYLTNTTTQTNLVVVPQLVPGSGSALVTGTAGAIAAPFGVGGLVTTALGGLISLYLGFRNRALAGNATVANQAAGALTQNIETLLEVLKQTPQGQAAMPSIKNYLMSHQTEVGVIQEVGDLVDKYVKNSDAKASADAIINGLKQVKGT